MGREPSADEVMRSLLAQLSHSDRLRMCARMFHTARVLAKAGILSDPETCDSEGLQRALLLRFYGRDLSPAQLEGVLESMSGHSLDAPP